MSNDVSALFAKKKEKKVKKNVVNMEDVGQVLERKARRQEENLAIEVDNEKRVADEEAYLKKAAQEESDWIDYGDQNVGRLEGLKIKDMGADSTEEEESEQTDEQKEKEEKERQGWGNLNKKEEEEMMPHPSEVAASRQQQGKYVPPTQRYGRGRNANIDINNEEMFPTIGAAAEVEKNHKEDKKNPWGAKPDSTPSGGGAYVPPSQRGGGGGNPWGDVNAQRSAALAAARAIGSTAAPTPKPPAAASTEPSPTSAPEAPKKNANAYVPPHLRNKS